MLFFILAAHPIDILKVLELSENMEGVSLEAGLCIGRKGREEADLAFKINEKIQLSVPTRQLFPGKFGYELVELVKIKELKNTLFIPKRGIILLVLLLARMCSRIHILVKHIVLNSDSPDRFIFIGAPGSSILSISFPVISHPSGQLKTTWFKLALCITPALHTQFFFNPYWFCDHGLFYGLFYDHLANDILNVSRCIVFAEL